jgi:TrmH family RNA methyltransferase
VTGVWPANLRIVLVSPRNPLNIGAAARAMSNFGFTDLHLVTPYDLAFREARSAVKSSYILEQAQVHRGLADALTGCTLVAGTTSVGHRDLHAPLYTLETAAPTILQHAAAQKVALLFGSEKFGLSNEDMSHCHWLLRIPSRTEHASMNLGQAVAICLYELIRDASASRELHTPAPIADAEQLERLTRVFFDSLSQSGYVQPKTSESSFLKLRRLIHRLAVPASDAETWLGMFRQIRWKTSRSSDAAGENPSELETPPQMPESGSH